MVCNTLEEDPHNSVGVGVIVPTVQRKKLKLGEATSQADPKNCISSHIVHAEAPCQEARTWPLNQPGKSRTKGTYIRSCLSLSLRANVSLILEVINEQILPLLCARTQVSYCQFSVQLSMTLWACLCPG